MTVDTCWKHGEISKIFKKIMLRFEMLVTYGLPHLHFDFHVPWFKIKAQNVGDEQTLKRQLIAVHC